jgi:hypothetical protein
VTSDRDAIIERRVQIATPSFSADEFVGTPRTEVVRVPTKVPGPPRSHGDRLRGEELEEKARGLLGSLLR